MFEQAIEAANALKSARVSKYDDVFTSEERTTLDEFVTYLISECNFKKTSASSYRANFSRASVKLSKNEKLNSDERSALRKFAEFNAS